MIDQQQRIEWFILHCTITYHHFLLSSWHLTWPVPKVYFVFVHTKGPHKNWNIHILIIIKVTVPPE